MVRNDLFITVPSFFKCPISLDVMKSPVSLCTGVTYDRSSIQAWLDNGNNTCPATMQVLNNKEFVPNHNLHRLIQIWSNSDSESQKILVSRQEIRDLVKQIETRKESCLDDDFNKVIDFAKLSDENLKFLAGLDGFVLVLVDVLSRNDELKKMKEQVIRVLELVLIESTDKDRLMISMAKNQNLLASILLVLRQGSFDSRISSLRVLESIASTNNTEAKLHIAETEAIVTEIIHLIGSETDTIMIEAGLSCLIAISSQRRMKLKMVRFGLVQTLGKLLAQSEPSSCKKIDKFLKLIEMISTCTEGRTAICADTIMVTAIIEKMLKVSNISTEHGVVILWSVCYLFRDQTAQENVMKGNGLTKILLIMQSNCSPSVRQMCGDLMKIFRVNSKSCLSCYDTKTTHIMPF